jgi:phosphopantetheinyl transferase
MPMPHRQVIIIPQLSRALASGFPSRQSVFALSRLVDADDCLSGSTLQSSQAGELNDLEQAALAAFKLPKRRAQWLTGRLCAKQAVIGYCREHLPQLPLPAANRIHIRNSPSGRPYLDCGRADLNCLDISISHSGEYAIALVASGPCGVDIQKDSESLLRVRSHFCLDPESDLLQRCLPDLDHGRRLTLLWTAKEAAKKALSLGKMPGFLTLLLTGCRLDEEGLIFLSLQQMDLDSPAASLELSILATRFHDYGISLILPETNKIHA